MDFEAEYDNRARVPEHPAIMEGWQAQAARYRSERSQAGKAVLGRVYGASPRSHLDMFHPDTPRPDVPIIVFIHGGYWRALDRSDFSHLAAGANAHGFSVAMPSYELCPDVALATIIEQVRHCCLCLWRKHKRRLLLCGHSAGGHLTATTLAFDWSAHGAPADLAVAGLSISGLFDLEPLLHTSVNEDLRLDTEAARAASPVNITPPPGRVLHASVGAEESGEFRRQSRLICSVWAKKGATTQYEAVEGANHFTIIAPLAEKDSALTRQLVGLADHY
jgi:arylformamidase